MAFTPYERLNVFTDDVKKELDKRRKSKNLVQTRAPFLKFTTAVDFGTSNSNSKPNLENSMKWLGGINGPYKDVSLSQYDGCKFFTLGLHGWDNTKYSSENIYGVQSPDGLIVGVTYKDGNNILVKTPQDDAHSISPVGYPPPGIENVKIERTKSGNVLVFNIDIVCYTKVQLDMLDTLAFIPGMDCILEWGNIISTPDGSKAPDYTLDFTRSDITDVLKQYRKKYDRQKFIDTWCAPNDFNYDFAIARISNIKTAFEDNKYKVSIVAYGQADAILHLSAYATTTEKEQAKQKQEAESTSIHRYFSENSDFILELQSIVATKDPKHPLYDYVTFFDEPVAPGIIDKATGALKSLFGGTSTPGSSTSAGAVNDLGQEKTYYIRFDKFINYFLNQRLISIINRGLNPADQFTKFVSDIANENETDPNKIGTVVGFNKHLLSTDPSVMIIVNNLAKSDNAKLFSAVASNLSGSNNSQSRNDQLVKSNEFQKLDPTVNSVTPFDKDANGDAGSMIPARGVWLNSKGIQQVFLGARTITEGMETLLNKINAATEGYWDMKLMHDDRDDSAQFRIVDDNHMQIIREKQEIYTFNKKLATADNGNTVGPELLSININMDYPKLIFAQLAIGGINNASSTPKKNDQNFVAGTTTDKNGKPLFTNKLSNLLKDDETVSPPNKSAGQTATANPNDNFQSALKNNSKLSGNTEAANLIGGAVFNLTANFNAPIPPEAANVIKLIIGKQTPITEPEAASYVSQLQSITPSLTSTQVDLIINLVKKHAQALIISYKNEEINNFQNKIKSLNVSPFRTETLLVPHNSDKSNKAIDNITQSKTDLSKDFE